MTWDSAELALERLKASSPSYWQNYLGFYSSWMNGFFNEPWAMFVALDDHGFHRGDGIFEAARIHSRAYIDLDAHLRRLENSAQAIGMKLPKPVGEIKEICLELARRVNVETATLRLFVTRGPGGFSPSPAEVIGSQLFAVLTKFKNPDERFYRDGVRAMFSTVAAKEAFWSQIKSCNYLQNVMMKKECLEKGFDFAISVDSSGRLCEGATENILLLTRDNEILVPRFDYTLRGTTVTEVLRIAGELVSQGKIRDARLADVSKEDLLLAEEAAFVGTTLGVLPIGSIEDRPIGSGRAGSICGFLHQRLMEKMSEDSNLRSPF